VLPVRPGEPLRLSGTPRTLQRLGWAPRVMLADGLRQCFDRQRRPESLAA
jgi:hypothetical protein